MNSGAASGIPSNLGILDQIAALHWIQENIQVSIIITMKMMMVIFMPKMLMVMVILMVIVILMAMMLIVMVILLAMMILVIFNNDHKADDC